jgi:hypothetical protein
MISLHTAHRRFNTATTDRSTTLIASTDSLQTRLSQIRDALFHHLRLRPARRLRRPGASC